MSACSRTAWTLARSRVPTNRTQLPFLYQTATIQRCPPTALPFARRHASFRPHTSPRKDASSHNEEFTDDVPFEQDSIPFERSSIPFAQDSIPFEHEDALPPTLDELEAERKTTMTGAERKAFEKLYKTFKAQNRTNGNRKPGEEDDQVADEYYEDDDDGSAKSIDAVFDEVFKEMPLLNKPGVGNEVQDLARKLEAETAQIPPEEKEEVAKFNKLRRSEYKRVNLMLKNAQTDMELWEVLEREVFAPIRVLNLDGQKEKKAEEDEKKRTEEAGKLNNKEKKKRNKREEVSTWEMFAGGYHPGADPQDIKMRLDFKKAISTPPSEVPPGPRRSVTIDKTPSPAPSTPEAILQAHLDPAKSKKTKKSKKTNSPTTPPPANTPPPQILFRNYPLHLTTAASLFQTHFPSSPLPLSLLPTIKSLGRSSYALGATPTLYALVLRAAWSQHASYTLLDSLLAEMHNSAIEADAETAETLRRVVGEYEDVRAGKRGRFAQAVYGMERFEAGIGRMREWRRRARDVVGDGEGRERGAVRTVVVE